MTDQERDVLLLATANTAHAALTLAQLALKHPPHPDGGMSDAARTALAEAITLHQIQGNAGVAAMLTVVLNGPPIGAPDWTYGAGGYSN